MLTSSDSCSMILVISSVNKNTRPAAPLASTAGPSPLAVTTVFSATRNVSIMAGIVANHSGNASDASLRRMRPGEIRAAGLLHRLEFHKFDSRQIGIEHVELPLAVLSHLRFFAIMGFPAVGLQNRSEEHTSELQSLTNLVCRLLLEKK